MNYSKSDALVFYAATGDPGIEEHTSVADAS